MAAQFNGRLTRSALQAAVLAMPAAQPIAPGTDAEHIADWLAQLHLLHGVPFHYLVPDADMLPAESIRFFQVDSCWVQALLDGAYSVAETAVAEATAGHIRPTFMAHAAGRAQRGVARQGLLHQARTRPATLAGPVPSARPAYDALAAQSAGMSGFLLRSAVVAGWPGLEVFGYEDAAGGHPLRVVRLETVAPALLFCLFDGQLARVDFREPAEALHFGLDRGPGGAGWQKNLRYTTNDAPAAVGHENGQQAVVALRAGLARQAVVKLAALAHTMHDQLRATASAAQGNFTAAEFALEMVEGMQMVTFQVAAPPEATDR